MSGANDHHIPAEWLARIAGTKLFYPSAGSDVAEASRIFAPILSELWFADINYPRGLSLPPTLPEDTDENFRLVDGAIVGDAHASMERRYGHRFLPPSRRVETYLRADGSMVRIVRRRGFGQIALGTEFADCSIGVFFYRGDSGGEGGSGVSYFHDRRARYEPLGNLFSLLRRKLTKPALIVTDGSNTHPRSGLPISRFNNNSLSGADAFELCRRDTWDAGGLRWRCVGFVGRRYGPTLVWGVEPS